MKGKIHSVESFGSVDGPGIRFVVFFKGCPMRCQYCHNPDTWDMAGAEEMSVEEIITAFNRNKSFYKNGGITATGGEPLMQMDFVTALFKRCKEENIHTCLDTSGITFVPDNIEKFDELIKYTDLVMLDIKHIDPEEHIKLTAQKIDNILEFAKYLDKNNIPMWIRHVVVPGITDNEDYLFKLGEFIGTLKNIKALDVLPYHTMGVKKYEALGMEYPLKGIEPMDKVTAVECKKIILKGIRKARSID